MAFFVEKVWTTLLLWLASATGLDPSGLFSIPSYPGQSIDLLASLGLHNSSRVGVEITVGPPPQLRTAYKLTGDFRDLKLPPSIFKQVADLLRVNPEFTISARLKQEPGNAGIIVSFAHGVNRYLELHSSGIKDEIRLHYTSSLDSIVYIETFRYPLADDRWHDLALSVSGAQVDLLIDCQPRFRRILKHGAVERNFSESQMQLWLGERNKQHFFKGIMQNVILTVGPYGYLASCQHLDTECPTCGQFYLLQNTVHELSRHLQELSERLVQAEKRISTVEECDCQKSCHVNGTVYADGFTWQSGCDLCSCVHGEIQCHPVECPEPDCKNPVSKSGECCLICKRRCLFYGQFYDHGESVTFKKCRECKCNDGNMKCFNIDPETNCPKLLCPPEEQFSVADHCCKFCPGVDYCAKGHFCHDNATCLNLQTTYACQCDQGFQGDGRMCTDVDECQTAGDLMGHHCRANTRCVNTPGSYICECLPGYRRVDAFNCAEVDECGGGEHTCDVNADCINTQGSYDCACRKGWSGDGYTCKPVCPQGCLNGGVCVQPGQCACPNGYTGESCERDLDECTAGLHRCAPHAAVCVNMMGWYYCRCKEGYRDAEGIGYPYSRNNLGSECIDINECDSNLHTCHPSAQCVNTNGSFTCICPPSNPNCKLSCLYLDKEIENGKTISMEKDPCQKCTCNKGVMKCEKPKCDCNLPENDHNECCPQCNKKYACRHQELSGVILMHGEQWSYQCQTCECFYGDIDCYDMKCPPLLCNNPIRSPEDCCAHCEDPCSFGNMGNSSALGQNCTFRGRIIKSGDQFVDDNDPCTACNCKDGVLCCSYNYHCGYDSRPVGFDGVVAPLPIEGDSSETAIDVHRQYSGAVWVANHSHIVSDSTSGG